MMMDPVALAALNALGAAAVTNLVTKSRFLQRPRLAIQWWFENQYIATLHPEAQDDARASDEWLSLGAYLWSCTWCVGVYIAGAVTLATDIWVGLPVPVLVWLASWWTAAQYGRDR